MIIESRCDVRILCRPGGLRRSASARRFDGSASADRDGCRADSGSADAVQRAGESVRQRSDGHGRGTATVRSIQLLRLSWRTCRWRHGPEPA